MWGTHTIEFRIFQLPWTHDHLISYFVPLFFQNKIMKTYNVYLFHQFISAQLRVIVRKMKHSKQSLQGTCCNILNVAIIRSISSASVNDLIRSNLVTPNHEYSVQFWNKYISLSIIAVSMNGSIASLFHRYNVSRSLQTFIDLWVVFNHLSVLWSRIRYPLAAIKLVYVPWGSIANAITGVTK